MSPHLPGRRALVAIVAGLLLASACSDDEPTASTASTAGAAPGTTASPSATEPGPGTPVPREVEVVAYLLRDGSVGPVARTAASADRVARDAVEGLLAGPTAEEADEGLTTAIPDGTELLGLAIGDGVATIDLSSEFAAPGDPVSVEQRVAQVVFTLTRFASVEGVAFRIDGAPVTTIGGAVGVELPVGRDDVQGATPEILLESPLPGQRVTDPLLLVGSSATFEGTVRVAVVDGEGRTVHDGFFTGSGANGVWGPFETSVDLTGAASGPGEVQLWQDDMSGELADPRVDLVVVPIVLP